MNARLTHTGDAGYLTIIVTHGEADAEANIFNCAANRLTESSFDGYSFFRRVIVSPTEMHYFASLAS